MLITIVIIIIVVIQKGHDYYANNNNNNANYHLFCDRSLEFARIRVSLLRCWASFILGSTEGSGHKTARCCRTFRWAKFSLSLSLSLCFSPVICHFIRIILLAVGANRASEHFYE